MLVYQKVLLDEILLRGMTVNCFRIYCSFAMADFMCISVVLWQWRTQEFCSGGVNKFS